MRPRALVTGGARRVGLAIAEALARSGCDVAITFRSSDPSRALERIRSCGAEASAHRVDLDDLGAVERFTREIGAAGLDVLVHNASVYGPDADPPDAAGVMHALRVNAAAPLLLSRLLADRLAASSLAGGGVIVAMCDIHAQGIPRAGHSAYSMSKAALAEMVRSLAVDLGPRVRVNGVAPGVVAWPESGPDAEPEAQQAYLRRVPLARAGTPEEAAETVRWLALDATYVTGQILCLDGGRSLR